MVLLVLDFWKSIKIVTSKVWKTQPPCFWYPPNLVVAVFSLQSGATLVVYMGYPGFRRFHPTIQQPERWLVTLASPCFCFICVSCVQKTVWQEKNIYFHRCHVCNPKVDIAVLQEQPHLQIPSRWNVHYYYILYTGKWMYTILYSIQDQYTMEHWYVHPRNTSNIDADSKKKLEKAYLLWNMADYCVCCVRFQGARFRT